MMVDLVRGVEDILSSLDPQEAEHWRNHAQTRSLHQYPPMAQLQLLNNHWHLRLAQCQNDTLNARAALRPDLTPSDWLDIFRRYVAPAVVDCTRCVLEK